MADRFPPSACVAVACAIALAAIVGAGFRAEADMLMIMGAASILVRGAAKFWGDKASG